MLKPEGDIVRRADAAEVLRNGRQPQAGAGSDPRRAGLAPSSVASACAGTGSINRPPGEETTEQARHAIRHGIEREEQQAAVSEVLDRRPSRKQGINQRQRDRAEQRPVQRPRTAEQHQQQDEDRQVEADEVGVDVLVLLRDQRASDAAGHGRDDEGEDLVAIDANADRTSAAISSACSERRRGRSGPAAGCAAAGA